MKQSPASWNKPINVQSIRHIVYSNVIVSLAAATLSAGISYRAGIDKWMLYGLFAFYATLAVYNGQRLFKLNRPSLTPWLFWVKKHQKRLFILSFLSSIFASIVLMRIGLIGATSFWLLGGAMAVSLFYVIRVMGVNLREIPMIKIHLIALTWVAVLVVFPLLNEARIDQIILVSFAHYCYTLAVAIPFDIRDLKYDLPSQRTVPQVLGVKGGKLLAVILLLVYALIMMFTWVDLKTNPLFYLATGTQFVLIVQMNEERSDMYCAGWIDGAIALAGLSYFM